MNSINSMSLLMRMWAASSYSREEVFWAVEVGFVTGIEEDLLAKLGWEAEGGWSLWACGGLGFGFEHTVRRSLSTGEYGYWRR